MVKINGADLDFREVNQRLRETAEPCEVDGCLGQRFLGAGMSDASVVLTGIPGNALGAYLNGGHIEVRGNAQDAVGDTMNGGTIVVHGSIGDAAGYAMRGGSIYVKGSAGYRAGVHMKEYGTQVPVLVIGGRSGSFLGEYQAGGVILVLGLHSDGKPIVGNFPCTGMHGGRLFIRGACSGIDFPSQVSARAVTAAEREDLRPLVTEYCRLFGADAEALMQDEYTLVTPDSANPYRQMYVAN